MKKKVLLLTITAGEGHTAPGKAILAQCEKMGAEVKIIDCFKTYNKFFYWAFDSVWRFIQNRDYLHWIYQFFHRKSQFDGPEKKHKGATFLPVKSVYKKVAKDIAEYNPDVIFCPHPTAARMAIEMKLIYKNMPPIIGLVTDIIPQPTWEKSSDADYVVHFTNENNSLFFFRGFKKDQLKALGMPARAAFNVSLDKLETRKKLGLENKTTIMMFFSNAIGKPTKLIKALDKLEDDFQIVHIAGRNEKEKAVLDKMVKKGLNKTVISLGFTTNIHEYMAAADYMVGKAGMNILNECLTVNLPLIATGKLVAQEKDNITYLTGHNAVYAIRNKKKFASEMDKLLKKPELLNEIKTNMNNVSKPHATRDIAKLVLDCAGKYSGQMTLRDKPLKRKKNKEAMAPLYTESSPETKTKK